MSRRNGSYADILIAEWGIGKCSPRVQTRMRRVLGELSPGAQMVLRRNPKLQVVAVSETGFSVWAYFPAHRKRQIVRDLQIELRPTARVLLVICETLIEQQPARLTDAQLRDHLGHTLLYLRSPKSRNECADASREWRLEKGSRTIASA
jgi:hypothetical protein